MAIITGGKGWVVNLVGEVTPEMEQAFAGLPEVEKERAITGLIQGEISVSLMLAGSLRVAGAHIQPMSELRAHYMEQQQRSQ